MNFEWLGANYVATTTLLTLTPATSGAALIDRKRNKVWRSDTTTASINATFSATLTVDRIILENTNFKAFRVYYGGATASTFTLDSGSDTTTSAWATNSATSLYLCASTVSTIQVTIDVSSTTDGASAYLGELTISGRQYTLPENPHYTKYKATNKAKQIVHELSDGGTTVYNISTNFSAEFTQEYQDPATVQALDDLYDGGEPLVFSPFPTVTGWTQAYSRVYTVSMVGDRPLDASGNSYDAQGFDVKVTMREVPK